MKRCPIRMQKGKSLADAPKGFSEVMTGTAEALRKLGLRVDLSKTLDYSVVQKWRLIGQRKIDHEKSY